MTEGDDDQPYTDTGGAGTQTDTLGAGDESSAAEAAGETETGPVDSSGGASATKSHDLAPIDPVASATEGSGDNSQAWVAVPTPSDPDAPLSDGSEDEVSRSSAFPGELGDRLDRLERTLAQAVALQEHQATLIRTLHAENQVLRQGELTQALKPFILDIARLHDDVAAVISRGGDELKKAAIIPEFILDVLEHQGVSQVAPTVGDAFDGKLHQGTEVVPISDPKLDGLIARLQRPGFIRDGGHLVRPARVAVYRYSPEVSSPGDEMAPDDGNATTDEARSSDVG